MRAMHKQVMKWVPEGHELVSAQRGESGGVVTETITVKRTSDGEEFAHEHVCTSEEAATAHEAERAAFVERMAGARKGFRSRHDRVAMRGHQPG